MPKALRLDYTQDEQAIMNIVLPARVKQELAKTAKQNYRSASREAAYAIEKHLQTTAA